VLTNPLRTSYLISRLVVTIPVAVEKLADWWSFELRYLFFAGYRVFFSISDGQITQDLK